MAKVMIHATMSLDGYIADAAGGVDWMLGLPTAPEDEGIIASTCGQIGAVVGGANRSQTIEDDELPYAGALGVPVYLMTRREHEPVIRDGTTYTFVVDDIGAAVGAAKDAAGDRWVSILGGSISRQCLALGLVDEIQLHVVPTLLGEGVSLFAGLGERVRLERVDTSAFASEVHLRYRVLR